MSSSAWIFQLLSRKNFTTLSTRGWTAQGPSRHPGKSHQFPNWIFIDFQLAEKPFWLEDLKKEESFLLQSRGPVSYIHIEIFLSDEPLEWQKAHGGTVPEGRRNRHAFKGKGLQAHFLLSYGDRKYED